jgi:hypothetical protein
MTDYLRHYIPYYAQLVELLQARKTLLNCSIMREREQSTGKVQHKRDAARTHLTMPSPEELQAFLAMQKAFSQPTKLTHFDPTRRFFLNNDASKEYGYGVMVYHAKDEKKTTTIASSAVKQFCFSRKCSPRQKRTTGPPISR